MNKDNSGTVFSSVFIILMGILIGIIGYMVCEVTIVKDCDTMNYFRVGDRVYGCVPAKLE